MISEVVMPQMGADMKEGTVLRWLKAEGDEVTRGEVIAEIETDKANIEIEAFDSGVFRKVVVSEGETVPVGQVIAVIGAPTDDVSAYASGARTTSDGAAIRPETPAPTIQALPPEAAATAPVETALSAPTAAPAAEAEAAVEGGDRLRVSPVARNLARDRGVDLSTVRGSGPEGRILRRDVEEAAAGPARPQAVPVAALAPPGAGDTVTQVPLNRIRQATARKMAQSKREVPHYYLTIDVDMTEALAFRAKANEKAEQASRISINDILILAAAKTLLRHPRFNSWWINDGLQLHSQINMSIAVALDDGLVAPALLDCAYKPLSRIAVEARDLAERARGNGSLKPEEYTSGTFTITNLGAYGIDGLVGIINPPQTGILGAGAVRERAVVRGGQVVARSMLTLVLSADHRATDGAEGARFLATLQQLLETPAMMLV